MSIHAGFHLCCVKGMLWVRAWPEGRAHQQVYMPTLDSIARLVALAKGLIEGLETCFGEARNPKLLEELLMSVDVWQALERSVGSRFLRKGIVSNIDRYISI